MLELCATQFGLGIVVHLFGFIVRSGSQHRDILVATPALRIVLWRVILSLQRPETTIRVKIFLKRHIAWAMCHFLGRESPIAWSSARFCVDLLSQLFNIEDSASEGEDHQVKANQEALLCV
ncbi:hypothetical protein K470DRAFT_284250 [Piedraia hortae CBS 480.64]|uniref:Uncharacterized protein n=1 Tax=Piedraia hortae CBS 480.64 TaxID=1314780 RepID=A0A6A7CBF6_9PEZI|nr:hypothetical protein K470DRAFT_284250 [Piedraia hortae CBS 480.64]